MLKERVIYHYIDENKNCAVSMLEAASDTYGLKVTKEAAALFAGFGGGMVRNDDFISKGLCPEAFSGK